MSRALDAGVMSEEGGDAELVGKVVEVLLVSPDWVLRGEVVLDGRHELRIINDDGRLISIPKRNIAVIYELFGDEGDEGESEVKDYVG